MLAPTKPLIKLDAGDKPEQLLLLGSGHCTSRPGDWPSHSIHRTHYGLWIL